MKKNFIYLLLLFSLIAQAQVTPSYPTIKLTKTTEGVKQDSLLVVGTDKIVKHIPFSKISNVQEYATASALPITGVAGKLYITKDNNKIYTWNGAFYSEFVGAKGEKGDQGPQGIQGVAGLTGLKGDKGDVGLTGSIGLTGAKGDKGDIGLTGVAGTNGLDGAKGDQGPQGFKGDTGLTGADGAMGVQGPQGIQGIQGETGLRGIQGETGPQGPIGFTGEKGADGTGVSIKGSFDNTSQLPASGAAGDAYLISGNLHVWNGTAWINVGSIQGPQGLIGLTGAAGSQGIQGVKGEKGDQGIQGIQGLKGDTGSFNGDITADQVTETATRKFQTPTQSAYNDATSSIQGQLNLKANTSSLGSNAYTSTAYLPLTGGNLSGDLTVYKTSGLSNLVTRVGEVYGYLYNNGVDIGLGSNVGSTGHKLKINFTAPDNSLTIDSNGKSKFISTVEASPATLDTQLATLGQVKGITDFKVDKVAGKSLIADSEITRLSTVTNQDISGKANIDGNNASGTWPISVNGFSSAVKTVDNRIISPINDQSNRLTFGFTSWNNNDLSPYADYLHLKSYQDASGGRENLLMFKKSEIGLRVWQKDFGLETPYSQYKDIAFTDDYRFTDARIAADVYPWAKATARPVYNKSDIGLSLVDNTSDINKPISTAAQNALNSKENAFSKNTAFNKNFGTTTGSVVEGGTLGSNAYSSTPIFPIVGNFGGNVNSIGNVAAKLFASSNALDNYGSFLSFGESGYTTQINSVSVVNGDTYIRVNGGGSYGYWRRLWHDGNFNPANYLPLGGGTLTGALNGTSATFSSSVRSSSFFAAINGNSTAYLNNDGNNIILGSSDGTTGYKLLINRFAPDNSLVLNSSGAATFSSNVTATSFNGSATLTGTPTAPTAASGTNTTQIATTAFVLANSSTRPYKVYTALLSQSGTNAPTAVVLENTLGGTVVWSRIHTGFYIGTLSGGFTNLKTSVFATLGGYLAGNNLAGGGYSVSGRRMDSDVHLFTNKRMNAGIEAYNSADGVLEQASIEIRVYD